MKRPSLVSYSDRPLSRGIATPLAMGFIPDHGGEVEVYRYVAPSAQGIADGLTPETAAPMSAINAVIAAAPDGAIIRVRADLGAYDIASTISLSNSHAIIRGWHPTNPTTRAIIRGGRAVPFVAGGANGTQIFRLSSGANFLTFERLSIQNVGNGFLSVGAQVNNIVLQDCDAQNFYRLIEGTGTQTIEGLIVRRVTAQGVERGFWRLGGNTTFLIEDVDCDGQNNADEPFTSLFVLEGAATGTCRRVKGRNSYHDAGSSYWNGDIFEQNNGNLNVVYEDCVAEDATDGGFDLKGSGTLLRCTARRTKRNFRFWGQFKLVDPISESPVKGGALGGVGGSGDAVHFGVYQDGAALDITNPTVIATPDNRATVFKVDNSSCTITVRGTDNIELTEDQNISGIATGTTGSQVVFNPALPPIAFSFAWANGFGNGVIPRETAVGTVVATAVITSGTGIISKTLDAASAFTFDGVNLKVAAGLATAPGPDASFTLRARHARGIVATSQVLAANIGYPAATGYDADAQAYFDRNGGTPSDANVAKAYSDFVVAVKATAGLWDKIISYWPLGAHARNFALSNLRRGSVNLVANVNATTSQLVTHIPGSHVRGDNSGAFLQTEVNLSEMPGIDINDLALDGWRFGQFRTADLGTSTLAFGISRNTSTVGNNMMQPGAFSDATLTVNLPAYSGMFGWSRSGLAVDMYVANDTKTSATLNAAGGAVPASAAALPAELVTIGKQGSNNGVNGWRDVAITKALTPTEMIAFRQARRALFAALRTALGRVEVGTVNRLPVGVSDDLTLWTSVGATVTANNGTDILGNTMDGVNFAAAQGNKLSISVSGLVVGRDYTLAADIRSATGSSQAVALFSNDASDKYEVSPHYVRAQAVMERPVHTFVATATTMEVGFMAAHRAAAAVARTLFVAKVMLNDGVEPASYAAS